MNVFNATALHDFKMVKKVRHVFYHSKNNWGKSTFEKTVEAIRRGFEEYQRSARREGSSGRTVGSISTLGPGKETQTSLRTGTRRRSECGRPRGPRPGSRWPSSGKHGSGMRCRRMPGCRGLMSREKKEGSLQMEERDLSMHLSFHGDNLRQTSGRKSEKKPRR